MSKNTGGPAFPEKVDRVSMGETYIDHLPGITLRDYFAAKAMQAFNTNPYWDDKDFSVISEKAYAQADAMIAERENAE